MLFAPDGTPARRFFDKYCMNYVYIRKKKMDEALDLSQYRLFMNMKTDEKWHEATDELFSMLETLPGAEYAKNNRYRLYIPADVSDAELTKAHTQIEGDIQKHLESKGFYIVDYIGNRCQKGKNLVKISKILSDNQELLSAYNADPRRTLSTAKGSEKLICFSSHRYDIAGMSANRHWTSCMDFTNDLHFDSAVGHIADDIEFGTVVAYLIEKSDRNIQNPLARILIKPRVIERMTDKKEPAGERIIFQPETSIYGNILPKFLQILEDVCDKFYGEERGLIRTKNVYDDGFNNLKPRKMLQHIDKIEDIYVTQNNIKDVIRACMIKYGPAVDLNKLDISSVTDMSGLFEGTGFVGDISQWDVSHVTNMSRMFSLSRFNGDISNWDVSNVTDMSCMFSASVFNGNISKWDVSKVLTMKGMFQYSRFTGYLNMWDVSSVMDLSDMFKSSRWGSEYTELEWDVSPKCKVKDFLCDSKLPKNMYPQWYKDRLPRIMR